MSLTPYPPTWKAGGGYPGLYPAAGVAAPGLVASSFNLAIANNVATPNTKIDFKVGPGTGGATAKFECILENSSAVAVVVSSTSTITANAGTTGANGLDTGVQAASTWYYLYLIYNGTTVASLISLSSTAPTLPGGYTYSALVGAVRSDGSTHFQTFSQFNKQVWTPLQNVFNNLAGPVGLTSQSVSTITPPIASVLHGIIGTTSTTVGLVTVTAGNASGTGQQTQTAQNLASSAFNNYTACLPFFAPMLTAQTFFWKSAVTNAVHRVDVSGWEYP